MSHFVVKIFNKSLGKFLQFSRILNLRKVLLERANKLLKL